MKTRRIVFLSLAAVFLIGCQETTDPLDPAALKQAPPQNLPIENEIIRLYAVPGPERSALRQIRNIRRSLDRNETETAQDQAVGLCRHIGEHFQADDGTFIGNEAEAKALCADVLRLVGVESGLADDMAAVLVFLSADDAAGITVVSAGTCAAAVIGTPGNSGISIPGGQTCLVSTGGAPPPAGAAGSQGFAPPPDGSLLIVITDCTSPVNIAVDIPVFGPCQKVTATTPDGSVVAFTGVPATLAMCDVGTAASLSPARQGEAIRVHQQLDDGSVKALPLALGDLCDELGSSPPPSIGSTGSNGLLRFARGLVNSVRDRVVGLVAPKPLQARAYSRMYRRNKKNYDITGFSRFQYALPSKMEILEGDEQTTLVGTQVPIAPAVLVTDAHDDPVEGALITFDVTAGGGSVASTLVTVSSDVNGEARVASWTIGTAVGTDNNTIEASCFGCATATEGEATDGPQPIFDPFTPLPLTDSPVGPLAGEPDDGLAVDLLDGNLEFTASGRNMSVAGVGKNDGNTEADVIFSSGDLAGSITRLTEAEFNGKNDSVLAADFDVLLITWDSDASLNVDWDTRLLPFLNAGGGVIYDGDPNNLAELAPGVPNAAIIERDPVVITVTATIPGLTTGIVNSFVNNHVQFTTTTFPVVPAGFTQFLTLTETHDDGAVTHNHNVGIYGPVGAGCIVLTGPDQDFHGVRSGGSGAELNQYNLLINELTFVTKIGGDNCVPPAP